MSEWRNPSPLWVPSYPKLQEAVSDILEEAQRDERKDHKEVVREVEERIDYEDKQAEGKEDDEEEALVTVCTSSHVDARDAAGELYGEHLICGWINVWDNLKYVGE